MAGTIISNVCYLNLHSPVLDGARKASSLRRYCRQTASSHFPGVEQSKVQHTAGDPSHFVLFCATKGHQPQSTAGALMHARQGLKSGQLFFALWLSLWLSSDSMLRVTASTGQRRRHPDRSNIIVRQVFHSTRYPPSFPHCMCRATSRFIRALTVWPCLHPQLTATRRLVGVYLQIRLCAYHSVPQKKISILRNDLIFESRSKAYCHSDTPDLDVI